MKEFELDMNPLVALKNNFWQALNLLRGFVEAGDYHFVLFLLTLQRKGLLRDIDYSAQSNLKQQLSLALEKLDGDSGEDLRAILPLYDGTIRKVNSNVVYELIHFLGLLDQEVLEKHFPEIYDNILYKLSKWQGRVAGEFMLPMELSRFVCASADLPPHAQVYNPFAGVASFGVLLPNEALYLGQEINFTNWAIGMMRLMAYDKETASVFRYSDSIDEWGMKLSLPLAVGEDENYHKSVYHDLVIANPPFGMRLSKAHNGRFGAIKNYEHFLIEKGIEILKENGKLVAIVSHGFLFRSGPEQNLRQYLVENDLLEMIISLPGGILHNTGIPVSILIINKNKSAKRVVRFIDAKNFIDTTPSREKVLKDYALNSFIKSAEESELTRLVPNETIQGYDFNLSVSRYFNKVFEGTELKELIIPLLGRRNTDLTPGKIIRIKDLKGDKFNYKLESGSSNDLETPNAEQEISESCLLIASAGEKLKPTYFNYNGTSIYLSPNIFAFKINEEKVDIDYLITELYDDKSLEQSNSFSIGSGVPKLRRDDFLSIRIQLPGPLEQQAKVKGLKQEHIKSKEKELFLEREILGLKDEAFREFASITHTLRQYLNALKANVSGTRKFISKNENRSISLKTLYSRNLSQNLGDHLVSLENTIDSMSRLLHLPEEQSSNLSTPVIEMEMDLSTLIGNAQNRFKNPELFQFEELFIDRETFAFPDGGYIGPFVNILPDDFSRIFSNIISNAIDHGFRNKTINNIVRTSLSFDSETNKLILEVSNNGNPFPKGFTLKHLTTRGEKASDSSGSGIGGADIKNLLDKYDATFDIKNEENNDFPVTYIMKFDLAVNVF